jgi:hypothetical protein
MATTHAMTPGTTVTITDPVASRSAIRRIWIVGMIARISRTAVRCGRIVRVVSCATVTLAMNGLDAQC